jgi:hypothetical protein
VTVPVVLHVDGLCMSLTLGCSTFLDLSETYAQMIVGKQNLFGEKKKKKKYYFVIH